MSNELPRTSHRINRRSLLRNGLQAGIGVVMAGAASSLLTNTVWAESGAPAAHSVQTNWWWCFKCQGLFFGPDSGHVSASHCPAGGTHDLLESSVYELWFSVSPPQIEPQPGWKWCAKCQGLFFGPDSGHVSASRCPAGGTHTTSNSGKYALLFGS